MKRFKQIVMTVVRFPYVLYFNYIFRPFYNTFIFPIKNQKKKRKLDAFLAAHRPQLEQWRRVHGKKRPPIIEDFNGEFRWMTRGERRRILN